MKWILSSPARFYGTVAATTLLAIILAIFAVSLRVSSFQPVEGTSPTAETAPPEVDVEVKKRLRNPAEVAVEAVGGGTPTVVAVDGLTTLLDVVTETEVCSVTVTRGEAEEVACSAK